MPGADTFGVPGTPPIKSPLTVKPATEAWLIAVVPEEVPDEAPSAIRARVSAPEIRIGLLIVIVPVPNPARVSGFPIPQIEGAPAR